MECSYCKKKIKKGEMDNFVVMSGTISFYCSDTCIVAEFHQCGEEMGYGEDYKRREF